MMVGMPYRWVGSGREWSGGPVGGPGMVKRPTRRARNVREALPEGR